LYQVTLNIISSAGFGEHFPWNSPVQKEEAHSQLPFSTTVIDSVHLCIWRALIPSWLYYLPVPLIARIKLVFEELQRHITNIVHEGNSQVIDNQPRTELGQGSLLRGLLQANDTVGHEQKLSDRELLSNIHVSQDLISYIRLTNHLYKIFLLAGHGKRIFSPQFYFAVTF
jgi:hypothetical protein